MLWLQVLAQLQAQQVGGTLPQQIKLQLPIQIQQSGTTSAQGGQVLDSACYSRTLDPQKIKNENVLDVKLSL